MQIMKSKVLEKTKILVNATIDINVLNGFYQPNQESFVLLKDQTLRVIRKIRLNIALSKAEVQFVKQNLNLLRKFWSMGKNK